MIVVDNQCLTERDESRFGERIDMFRLYSSSARGRISTTLRMGSNRAPTDISISQRPSALILSAPSPRPTMRTFSGSRTMRLPSASLSKSALMWLQMSAGETEPKMARGALESRAVSSATSAEVTRGEMGARVCGRGAGAGIGLR